MPSPTPVLTAEEINLYLDDVFPELNAARRAYVCQVVGEETAVVTCAAGPESLRPGGTVSGPTLMTLADIAAWVVILAHVGRSALTVTTHLSIDFLRKPEPGLLYGRARLMKLGKRLAVSSVEIGDESGRAPYAIASATYSIPPPTERL